MRDELSVVGCAGLLLRNNLSEAHFLAILTVLPNRSHQALTADECH